MWPDAYKNTKQKHNNAVCSDINQPVFLLLYDNRYDAYIKKEWITTVYL